MWDHTQGGKHERRLDEAMAGDTKLHDVQTNVGKVSYVQNTERYKKQLDYIWWTGNICIAAETLKQTT